MKRQWNCLAKPTSTSSAEESIFFGVSALLILAGVASLVVKGGPKLGIDFKGGTLVYVKLKDAPDLDAIRNALTSKGLEVATMQPFEEGEDDHELKIDLNLAGEIVETSGKDQLIETLRALYPGDASKLDLNNAGVEALTDRLRRNAQVAGSPLSSDDVRKAAEAIVEARDQPPHSGLLRDFSQVSSVEGVTPDIMSGLQAETYWDSSRFVAWKWSAPRSAGTSSGRRSRPPWRRSAAC